MLKEFKPTTPSQRKLIRLKNQELSNTVLLKHNIKKLKNAAGRNNSGKITVYHKGGGVKRRYRQIDFFRNVESSGIVLNLEYDPCRTAPIAAIFDFKQKTFYYILQPKHLKVGDIVKTGPNADIKIGHALPLLHIPVGSNVHNISVTPGDPATLCRSAGNFVQLLEKTQNTARIKLPSKKQQYVKLECCATIGTLAHDLHFVTTIGKAGRNRWLNKRPTVRGVAMNPIDHPHGGGEGKTSGGRTAVTPWGKPSKHKKTSTSKLLTNNK